MAKSADNLHTAPPPADGSIELEQSTYEIIRHRLQQSTQELRSRLNQLNDSRRQVFGTIPTSLIATEQIGTAHNCVARDMVALGDRFIFGFNVHLGLKTETALEDVFAIYRFADESFHEEDLSLVDDSRFRLEFQQLYKYYSATRFVKFHLARPHLYMVFQVGKTIDDVRVFKWVFQEGALHYVDNRSEHELRTPPQHEFLWKRTHRDLHRQGQHPHISVEDILFVETVGGDLTIKVEDNTDDGQGIYREPVEDPDQTLDDAEIYYAVLENLVLLKIRPFREPRFRYFVFNRKHQHVIRQDAIEDACVLLPDDHGIVFSSGYYTQLGTYRTFDATGLRFQFEKRVASANGEDHLFIFHHAESGDYLLLSYNVIEQQVEPPVRCQGYCLFDNGRLLLFRSEGDARKHHAIQIWQTPLSQHTSAPAVPSDSMLFKIGNRDVVRAIAECRELLHLLEQQDTFADLYLDLVKKTQQILDGYFWLKDQAAFALSDVLGQIRQTASAAVSEFDKVQRIREATRQQFDTVATAARHTVATAARRRYQSIEDFVEALAELRHTRGRLISLLELKYIDSAAVTALEAEVIAATDRLSQACVEHLAQPESLAVYARQIDEQHAAIAEVETGAQGKVLDESLHAIGAKLEMLIDIVSNLRIDDATQRTAMTDAISTNYAALNQTRATLRVRLRELMSSEGAAEFAAQLKLLSQAVSSYLDVCDTPQRCDEYLTKMMVQVEEIEGRFAEFDEFLVELAEKRDEIYSAFDARKLQLLEARNRRAMALATAAERILSSIQTRVNALESLDAIHSLFAADLMVEKVRDIVRQLLALDETVKVDEIQSRLKTIREDAARQLRDRQDLFVDGQNLIRLGQHQFTVNIQPLDLAIVVQDDRLHFHISGTNFLEPVDDEALNAAGRYWQQAVVSENRDVYRGEYLAYQIFRTACGTPRRPTPSGSTPPSGGEVEPPSESPMEESRGAASALRSWEEWAALDDAQLTAAVQKFMAPRYAEGYLKGVHDHDAAAFLRGLLQLHRQLGWLRFDPASRALANLAWAWLRIDPACATALEQLETRLRALRAAKALGIVSSGRAAVVEALRQRVAEFQFSQGVDLGDPDTAAEFWYEQWMADKRPAGLPACELAKAFRALEEQSSSGPLLDEGFRRLPIAQQISDARDWLLALSLESHPAVAEGELWEALSLLLDPTEPTHEPIAASAHCEVSGLLGEHARLQQRPYRLNYHEFLQRLGRFHRHDVPEFERFQTAKAAALAARRDALRLSEFKPKVLTSFVRNRLIDEVYLPLIGNNLAKQLGAAGEQKRTDRMGLLLLISPPGYGKTTLMEYVANRLGLTFVKINGPALGHHVTSLDPDEAPHASAREEVQRLNLALEMGDNVMIYVDDIQHTHTEFLQKFISLCDATRRIEGVYRGRPKTYDLRGRKVCVVMAGNPYTESGEKFHIPDMLANRADTYNLGDVIGGHQDLFELSYIENCVTSNPTLSRLPTHGWDDVFAVLSMAAGSSSEGLTLKGNYSIEEIQECVAVMRRLLQVRDHLLRINRQYIDSAAQADAFRTEPRFQLQGSYRDMNKIAERIAALMNDEEFETLLISHYENQAQTLTTGAEANLLKFRELTGKLHGAALERWNEIKRTFQRNLVLGNIDRDHATGQIIGQMALFSEGLSGIQRTIERGVQSLLDPSRQPAQEPIQSLMLAQVGQTVNELSRLNETLAAIGRLVEEQAAQRQAERDQPAPREPIHIVNRIPRSFLEVIRHQFEVLERWIEPLQRLAEIWPAANELTRSARITRATYEQIVEQLKRRVAD